MYEGIARVATILDRIHENKGAAIKKFAFLLSLSLAFYGNCSGHTQGAEKEEMALLFEYFAKHTAFPYVLIGSKPLAIDCFFDATEAKLYFCAPVMLRKWWQTWERQNICLNENFIFRVEDPGFLYFFNKKKCLEVVKEHFDLFKALGESPLAVCEGLFKCRNTWDFLKKDNRLYGILLGFGRLNSTAYYDKYSRFDTSVDLKFFNNEDPNNFTFFPIPGFMAIESAETAFLRKTYAEDQQKIRDAFEGQTAEEVFLLILTED